MSTSAGFSARTGGVFCPKSRTITGPKDDGGVGCAARLVFFVVTYIFQEMAQPRPPGYGAGQLERSGAHRVCEDTADLLVYLDEVGIIAR